MSTELRYKLADSALEYEAIHRLNYRSFVEEIPQHAPNPERRLIDRFHEQNTYAICLEGDQLVGMIAGRCNRPFSLDAKLPNLDSYLPPHQRAVEVRLLAVLPRHRKQAVFVRLAGLLAVHFRQQGCDLAIISGTTRQIGLYRHLGFVPFGPLVGGDQAPYQPMALTLESFGARAGALLAQAGGRTASFLPGPVEMAPAVRQAYAAPVLYHRGAEFAALLARVRRALCELAHAPHAVVMYGSGTLANDAVAAQLSTFGGRGLVLANGEFGERLADHARRWRLQFDVLKAPWGDAIDLGQVQRRLESRGARWLWAVAGETSTGVANPHRALQALCRARGVDLCLDAISALGLYELDLDGVRLATTVSGKALGAYAGLSVVFHDGRLTEAGVLPRYLDLAAYEAGGGVPYTQSSPPLAALDASLRGSNWPARQARIAQADGRLRAELRRVGFAIVARDCAAMPGVVTLALPEDVPAERLAARMERLGYQLAHRSDYLVRRNWLQICLMGQWQDDLLERLPGLLAEQTVRSRGRSRSIEPNRFAPSPSWNFTT
jgi:aspartate aminotransferase-like enzyme